MASRNGSNPLRSACDDCYLHGGTAPTVILKKLDDVAWVERSETRVSLSLNPGYILKKVEPACKPGSVEDSHSSRAYVAVRLKRPTREQRGPRLMLPYLVLLRVGFTLPPALPQARCALTAPFHPYRRPKSLRRYIFCGTGRGLTPPRRYLALRPMEPGLSSMSKRTQRLSSRLMVSLTFYATDCAMPDDYGKEDSRLLQVVRIVPLESINPSPSASTSSLTLPPPVAVSLTLEFAAPRMIITPDSG